MKHGGRKKLSVVRGPLRTEHSMGRSGRAGSSIMADLECLGILKKDVDGWYDWRGENPGVRPELSEALDFGSRDPCAARGTPVDLLMNLGYDEPPAQTPFRT
jgi:hypothetical protein